MDEVAEFFDRRAETYDAELAGLEATPGGWAGEDVGFYRELATEAEGPALEVGVGTGRVYLELLREGLDVDGVDLSAGMLERLREKAASEGLEPSVWQANVTELAPDRAYGLVYCPARAFNHLATLDQQRAAARRIYDALAPGGRFALNTFVPDPEYVAEHYGEWRTREIDLDGERYVVEVKSEMTDAVELLSTYHSRVLEDGEVLVESTAPLALIPKNQFALLFELAGFETWSFYGGFEHDPLESSGQEMVAVARK